MISPRTVGELRELLAGVPDGTPLEFEDVCPCDCEYCWSSSPRRQNIDLEIGARVIMSVSP